MANWLITWLWLIIIRITPSQSIHTFDNSFELPSWGKWHDSWNLLQTLAHRLLVLRALLIWLIIVWFRWHGCNIRFHVLDQSASWKSKWSAAVQFCPQICGTGFQLQGECDRPQRKSAPRNNLLRRPCGPQRPLVIYRVYKGYTGYTGSVKEITGERL